MKFKTAYDPVEEHDHCGIEFTMPSLTVQDEKEETDINYIVNKYADGQNPAGIRRGPSAWCNQRPHPD